jgi:hypothetical protein
MASIKVWEERIKDVSGEICSGGCDKKGKEKANLMIETDLLYAFVKKKIG